MMIPLARDLGQRVAPAQVNPRGDIGPTAVTQAVQNLAGTAQHEIRQYQEQQEQLDRNDAGNALLDARLQTRVIAKDVADQVQTGQLGRDQAEQRYTELAGKAVADTMTGVGKTRAGQQATERAQIEIADGRADVTAAVVVNRRQQFAADAAGSLDTLGKLATLPNVPIEDTVRQAQAYFPVLAQKAGIPLQTASKALQDNIDNWRFDRAAIDLDSTRRDAAGLEAFGKRLDNGGDLYGQLDPQRVLSLRRSLESHQYQLGQAAQHQADKREKVAERDVGSVTRQIESGIPLTAGRWNQFRTNVAGTGFESAYDDLARHEAETQTVLRMPIDQQQQFVDDKEAALYRNGGTMVDKANLQRIRQTIDTNTKQLQEAPLVAASRLFGVDTKPIDLSALSDPNGGPQALASLSQTLNARGATLAAMQKQYGDRVGMRPLLPQEAATLTKALGLAAPSQAADLFATLRQAVNSDDVYAGAMQQLAADSPVKARAGMLAAQRAGITLQSNWIRDDVSTSSRKVAETMLLGEQILNPTKDAKAIDGRPRSIFIPDQNAFTSAFVAATGDLYRGRPQAQTADLEAVRAYYTGKAAQTGASLADPKSPDSALVKEAITATLGSVVNVNGHGNITAPLGVNGPELERKLRQAFADEASARGLPADFTSQFEAFGFVNYRADGTYVVTMGGLPVIDPRSRKPVVLDLVSIPGLSRYRRPAEQMIPTR